MKAISAFSLDDIFSKMLAVEVIAVDEAQFFKSLSIYANKMANNGKIVILTALNAAFRRAPFPEMATMFAIAERIDKLTAVCIKCCIEASYTYRKDQRMKQHIVGGVELYKAVCRACYNSLTSLD